MSDFSFCPKCGSKLKSKKLPSEDKARLVCTNNKCAYIFYLNPSPTVSALIEKNNKVLLVKRAIDPFKGDWDTPGGFVEMGETFEQGLARELKEEINQDIVSTQYFGSGITPYVNGPDKTLGQNLCVFYLCQTKGKIKPGDDVGQAKFFSWDKLPENIADFHDVKQMLAKRQKEILNSQKNQNPIIKIGIGVIIKNPKNKILLIKRKGSHGEGQWACPGGSLEYGEKIIDGAKREIKEEIGLKLKDLKTIIINEDLDYLKSHKVHWVTVICQTQISKQTPIIKEPDKISQIKWFSLDKLPSPIFPPTQKTLKCFKQGKISLSD